LGVDLFVISTDTDFVYLDFKKPSQRPLRQVRADELREYLTTGHFPPGNMGPKIESVLRFLGGGGPEAIITSCDHLRLAVSGSAGTHVFPAQQSVNVNVHLGIEVPTGGR
jgi:carbamate kinase